MPIIAVAVAVFADVSAAGAFGALAAGALDIGTIATVVGAVGATVAAVGAITGDKTLSTIGMVLGGIGGIGSLAASAGIIGGDAASAADDAASSLGDGSAAVPGSFDSADAGDASAASSGDTFSTIAGQVDPTAPDAGYVGGYGDTADAVTGTVPGDVQSPASSDLTYGNLFGTANDAPKAEYINSDTNSVAPTDPATNPTNTSNAMTPGEQSLLAQASTSSQAPIVPGEAGPAASDGSSGGSGGILGTLMKGDNAGLLAMGGIQAIGSFLSGALNPLTPAQIAQANAQAALNQAQANTVTQQNVNMGQPIPTATRTQLPNVTGAPAGIINSPTTGTTSGITGAPA